MSDDIPLFRIAWDANDVTNAVDSITRGSYWANGPYVDEFEEALEAYLEVEHAVTFNSGTTALVSALEAAGVAPGDEVIVPSFTFIATANAVRIVGAEPVFADVETDSYGLDPDSVAAAITDDTSAVLPVHYAGKACDLDALPAVARRNDIALIEDAAEAFGATLDEQKLGTVGDAGVLSFCQNKVITTGEGGAVITDDDDLAASLRLLRSHGRATDDYFDSTGGDEYVTLGNNFRMPDVVAAIGTAQVNKAEDLIARRRRAADQYSDRLVPVAGVAPPIDPSNGRHVYQLYTVTFEEWVNRDAVVEALAERAISSKVYFDPVHLSTYYRETEGYESGHLPVTEALSERVLSLPIFPDIESEQIQKVVDAVATALEEQRT